MLPSRGCSEVLSSAGRLRVLREFIRDMGKPFDESCAQRTWAMVAVIVGQVVGVVLQGYFGSLE